MGGRGSLGIKKIKTSDALSFNFDTEENKKEGNTIYIDKKLISGLISTHNGVIGDINQMAVLTAKIGHEYKHDGKNGADEEVTKQVQGILSANPSLSKAQLKELLLAQGMDEEDVDKAIGNVFEDISCHAFEASIWGGLKGVFGVSNFEEDAKAFYYTLGAEKFSQFLSQNFILGLEHNLSNYVEKEVYESIRNNLKEYKEKKGVSYTETFCWKLIQYFSGVRTGYIETLRVQDKMDEYGVQDFSQDLDAAFDIHLNMSVEDYNKLISNQLIDLRNNSDIRGLNSDWVKERIGESFNNVFNLILQQGKKGVDKFNEINNNWSKSFIDKRMNDNSRTYEANSVTWFFELYRVSDNSKNRSGKDRKVNERPYVSNEYKTFLEYYMRQDLKKIKEISKLISGKTINIGNDANDGTNTQFIANITVLYNTLNDLTNATKKKGGWSSIEWRDGFRYGNTSSPHSYNMAIDIPGVKKANGEEYNDLEMYEIIKSLRATGHYAFMEFKDKGFHIGEHWNYENSANCPVAFGNYGINSGEPKCDTDDISKANLTNMFLLLVGVDSEEDLNEQQKLLLEQFKAGGMYLSGNFYYVSFDFIDQFIQNNF